MNAAAPGPWEMMMDEHRDIVERLRDDLPTSFAAFEAAKTIVFLRQRLAEVERELEESERQWNDLVISAPSS